MAIFLNYKVISNVWQGNLWSSIFTERFCCQFNPWC